MSVAKTYRCDLCRDPLTTDGIASSKCAIGLYWEPSGKRIIQQPAHKVEHHICPPCLSSLQHLPNVCGQGYECDGGPNCGSDHK